MPAIKINAKLERFMRYPKPIKVIIGGRGSGKSLGVADIMTIKMLTERCDVYCLREYQDSINDSVHRAMVGAIRERLQFQGWDIQENKIVSPFGNKTTYRGAARNPDSIQSAQDYKYSWFEEAHRASENSIDKLLPTILRNPGAECWFTANPQSSGDPFSQRFIVPYLAQLDQHGYYEDDVHMIAVVNWRDNPWWNEDQERLRRWDYENLPRSKYDWIWEGKFNDSVDKAIIKPEWFDAAIDAHLKIPAMKPIGVKIAAYDPSDGGKDPAAICIRHGSIIEHVSIDKNTHIDENCNWALSKAINAKCNWFVWDGDGMGTGLKAQVSRHLNGIMDYHMFRGGLSGVAQDNANVLYDKQEGDKTSRVLHKDVFYNNRAQYYGKLQKRFYNTWLAVEKGEYINPDDMIGLSSEGIENMQGLRAQICRIPEKENGRGLFQLVAKKDLDMDSPNESDAIMMSLCEQKKKVQYTPPKIRGWNG